MAPTSRPSVKHAFWESMFPETARTLQGPSPEDAKKIEENDAKMRNEAILAALRMAGVGLLGGGGARLLQEGLRHFMAPKPEERDPRAIAIDIHRPQLKVQRRVKRAVLESPKDWDLYYPLMIGAPLAGMYGGYQGMRSIADWLRKRNAESEIEAARKEFEEALDEQYAASRQKFSSLRTAMDTAYERWLESERGEKQANVRSAVVGAGLGTMALIWLLSHKAAYSRLKKSDPEAFRKKVMEYQRRLRQSSSPPPIMFDFPDEEDTGTGEGATKAVKSAEEHIPGGKAEGMSEADIAKKHGVPPEQIKEQLDIGQEIEKEHTPDEPTAREIGKDHTVEDPKYYDPHLQHMEEEAKSELDKAGPLPLKEEPNTSDVASILKFVAQSSNLDDKKMHELAYTLGLKPCESEEVAYSALQDLLKAHGNEVDPAKVREKEPEDDEGEQTEGKKPEGDGKKPEGEGKKPEGEKEKSAAAAEHACGRCEYFNGGKCAQQDKVIKAVGEDNLTIFLSNPTKTNSCPVFEDEGEEEAGEPVESDKINKAAEAGFFQQAKDWAMSKVKGIPAVEQQTVQAAKDAAQDPSTLEPSAKAVAGNQQFQEGVNEAALERAQSIPLIGGLFGSK